MWGESRGQASALLPTHSYIGYLQSTSPFDTSPVKRLLPSVCVFEGGFDSERAVCLLITPANEGYVVLYLLLLFPC